MFSELFFGTVTQLFLRRQRERILVTLVGFFLAIVFLPASVQAEEFAVDTTAAANNTYSLVGAPAAVCISDTNCFVFYLDSGGDIEVASTTDSGLTWSSTRADSVNTTDAVSVGVWWDGWTPGTTTTRYIHIVTTDTGVDDTYYTRYDTQTHTLSTSVLATTQEAVCTQGTDCYPAITMASNGVLFIANSEGTDRWVVRCTTDCTTAVNWSEATGGYQSTAGDDPSLLAPIPGTNNILLMWWDVSADALYYNIYSATSSSWTLASAVSIATAIEDNTTYDAQLWGMAIATTSGDIALVFTDDTNDYTTQDHDIRFYLYSSSTGWTAKTNPVTNAVGGITGAKVAYNPQDDVWYVVYARRSTIGTATTARIYYRYSSDDGTTWSEEQGPLNDVADEVNGLTVNITGYSRFGVWWNYLTSPYQDQLFYTPLAALHVPVTVSGVLYEADGVTPVSTSETITLVLGTSSPTVVSTSSAVTTGAFSVTGVVDDPLRYRVPLMLYVDGDVALPATAVTAVRNMTTSVTNFPLVVDDVTARTSVLSEVRASDFYIYDSADDSDLTFVATSSGGYVEVESGQEFVVATGTIFHMDAPLRLNDMTVATSATARASSTLTLTGDLTQNGTFSSAATTTWTARSAAAANYWSSVTYGNGLFVAVAYDAVMTSPDGITWTARTAAAANSWSSVTYGNGLFVAVCYINTILQDCGVLMTSPDGITWTARTAAEANQWFSVTYGNGLFVAVAGSGTNRVMTSPDGITWTARAVAEERNWSSVTYGNGLFVAVAYDAVMTSPDGITWTARTAAAANYWYSVTYGNGLFVAVAQSGTNRVMTSPDGITWTARAAAENNSWYSITYGNGLFVAVSQTGTNRVMTSPDGITWTARTAAEANQWSSVTYGNGLFVAVSQTGTNRVMTSYEFPVVFSGSDSQDISGVLINTTSLPSLVMEGSGTKTFSSIASTTSLTVATSSGVVTLPTDFTLTGNYTNNATVIAPTTWYFTGGTQYATGSWTGTPEVTLAGGAKTWYTPASTSNLTIENATQFNQPPALTVNGDYTNNGTTTSAAAVWTARTAAAANSWSSVTYGNGLFVAVAYDAVMTSPDGITWTARTAAAANSWSSVTYGNGLFVAVAYDAVMTSPDGITWTARTAAAANSWTSVTYGNGLFVAVAYDAVMTSPDGITWTARTAAEANQWSSVTYGNGLFVAVAYDAVMTSPDGITWTARTAAANNWSSVTYGNGLFVAVCSDDEEYNPCDTVMTSVGWATTTFASASAQNVGGSLTGASVLGNVVFAGAGQKTFTSAASTTNLTVLTTATTTFTDSLSVSGNLTAAAGSVVRLASFATTTVSGNLSLLGTSGNPVSLRAENDGDEAYFVRQGSSTVTYTTITDNHACGSTGGEIDVSGGNNVDGGNTACWIFYSTDPALALAASAQFYVGQATTTLPTLVVTEAETPGITTANDIRLTIATTTTDFRFDTTITTPTFGGTAAGKVSGTVSYEDDGATLVVTVTENFAASDTLTLSQVAVGSFAAISTDASVLAIHTDGTTAGAPAATSTETFRITGLLAVEEHSAGQVENQFSWQNETDAPLFAFALTPTGENATVTDMVLTVSGLQGVETTELTNFALYEDVNGDALLDGGDLLIDGAGIFTTNGQHGAVTFSVDFLATTTRDYIVVGDTDGIDNDDALVFRLATTGVTAIGATSLFQPVVESTVSSVQHSRFRSGGGGGDSDRIGGAPPPGAGTETGGGSDGGESVGEEEEGENITPDADYYRPSATGETHNEWTNPSNAYASDGAYATAASTNLRQTYYGFAFNLPSGNTIQGISVKLDASGTTADGTIDVALSWDGGNSYTSAKATPTLSGSDVVYMVGGAADTWGRSWSTANFASEQFRLRVTAQPASNTVRLDALEVRVFHHASGGGSGGGGGI